MPDLLFSVQAGKKGKRYAYWRLRYRRAGQMRNASLGAYPDVSFAKVRRLYKVHATERLVSESPEPLRLRNPKPFERAPAPPAPIDTVEDIERLRTTPGWHRVNCSTRLSLVVEGHDGRRTPYFSWRYSLNGRQDRIRLGTLSTISLDQAREKAAWLQQCLDQGADPHVEWERSRPPSDGLTQRERERALYMAVEEIGLFNSIVSGDPDNG